LVTPIYQAGQPPTPPGALDGQHQKLGQVVLKEIEWIGGPPGRGERLAQHVQPGARQFAEAVAVEEHAAGEGDDGGQRAGLVQAELRAIAARAGQQAIGVGGPQAAVGEGAGNAVAQGVGYAGRGKVAGQQRLPGNRDVGSDAHAVYQADRRPQRETAA
jgi:hypothetical protein